MSINRQNSNAFFLSLIFFKWFCHNKLRRHTQSVYTIGVYESTESNKCFLTFSQSSPFRNSDHIFFSSFKCFSVFLWNYWAVLMCMRLCQFKCSLVRKNSLVVWCLLFLSFCAHLHTLSLSCAAVRPTRHGMAIRPIVMNMTVFMWIFGVWLCPLARWIKWTRT